MRKPAAIFLLLIFSMACMQATKTVENAPAKPSQSVATSPNSNVSNNSIPSKNNPANQNAKYFNGKGKVTKINMEIGSVELDHQEIVGLMPAMIMEFYVKDKSQLEKIKVGDNAEFVLEDKGGAEIITEIKKIEK